VSKLAAEDRCRLNGLALAEGRPRYVTAVSQSDVVDGWRDRRIDGGVVLEVPNSRVPASSGGTWMHLVSTRAKRATTDGSTLF
jgi:uncharacterized protein (TIGR03032 family)